MWPRFCASSLPVPPSARRPPAEALWLFTLTAELRSELRFFELRQSSNFYQSGQTELFRFRWRVLFSGRRTRHYEMSLCYLKFKLGWIIDADVTFGSIFNLGSNTTAGLAPVLRLLISKVHCFEWDKNIFLWTTDGFTPLSLCSLQINKEPKLSLTIQSNVLWWIIYWSLLFKQRFSMQDENIESCLILGLGLMGLHLSV